MDILVGFAFLMLFCMSALGGTVLRDRLGEAHLTKETMDALRLVTGLLVTFAALVLSLQLSSARSAFDLADRNRSLFAGHLARLDQCLRVLGPPAEAPRLALRRYTAAAIASTWPAEPPPAAEGMPNVGGMAVTGEDATLSRIMADIGRDIDSIVPQAATLQNVAARCRSDYTLVQASRWAVIEDTQTRSSSLFIGIISFWLALVFLSFGLQVPRKRLSGIILAIGVVSIASVMFVIVDLAVPYGGMFGIRSTAMRNALGDMLAP